MNKTLQTEQTAYFMTGIDTTAANSAATHMVELFFTDQESRGELLLAWADYQANDKVFFETTLCQFYYNVITMDDEKAAKRYSAAIRQRLAKVCEMNGVKRRKFDKVFTGDNVHTGYTMGIAKTRKSEANGKLTTSDKLTATRVGKLSPANRNRIVAEMLALAGVSSLKGIQSELAKLVLKGKVKKAA